MWRLLTTGSKEDIVTGFFLDVNERKEKRMFKSTNFEQKQTLEAKTRIWFPVVAVG